MYHDTVQLNEPIIKKETLDFHRGRPVATVGWKNYIISPVNQSLVIQITCCAHCLMRNHLLLKWSVFNCGLFWTGPWWMWSVSTCTVCYERGVICYEHGLLWMWSVMNGFIMNGSVMSGSVMIMVCYERGLLRTLSVMNIVCCELVCYERGLFSNAVRYERGRLWTGLLRTWSVVICLIWTGLFWKGTVQKPWTC